MGQNYSNINYFCWKNIKKKKIKTKNIKIYLDKNLKNKIYVLDSGLNANSFIRKNQFNLFSFSKNLNNVTLSFEYLNFWGLFYVYPFKYKIENYKHTKFNTLLNMQILKNKQKLNKNLNNLSFKYSNKLLFWFFQNKNLLKMFLIKNILKKYKRFTYFINYEGLLFKVNKNFFKKTLKPSLFRGKIKNLSLVYSKLVLTLTNSNLQLKKLCTYSKLYIYFFYSKFLFLKMRQWFENLHWIFHKFRRYKQVSKDIVKKNRIKRKKNKKLIKLRPMPQQEFRLYYKYRYLENINLSYILLKKYKIYNNIIKKNIKEINICKRSYNMYFYYTLKKIKNLLENKEDLNFYKNKYFKLFIKKSIFNYYVNMNSYLYLVNSIENKFYDNSLKFSNKKTYYLNINNKKKRQKIK